MGKKIVLGLGDNVDYEASWDSGVLESLVSEYGITAAELDPGIAVNSERELLVSMLGFLRDGMGGEQFVADASILERFAARLPCRITLGGTAVRAAIAMRKLGYTSGLHLVTLNDHVRRLLPPDCPYVCSAEQDSLYPHLIIQFVPGTRVAANDIDITACQSNRIIYVNDPDNCNMLLSNELGTFLADAKVFLVSGFNAMRSEELLAERLEALLQSMGQLPANALVFYEDACFHNRALSRQIREALQPFIQIHSLNEDELQAYLGRKLDLFDPGDIAGALRDVSQIIQVPVLVVHTRAWALAWGSDASAYREALQGGIAMAGTRYRLGDDFSENDYCQSLQFPPQQQGALFAVRLNEMLGRQVCCLPSIEAEGGACTTIGLGDAFVGGFISVLAGG